MKDGRRNLIVMNIAKTETSQTFLIIEGMKPIEKSHFWREILRERERRKIREDTVDRSQFEK